MSADSPSGGTSRSPPDSSAATEVAESNTNDRPPEVSMSDRRSPHSESADAPRSSIEPVRAEATSPYRVATDEPLPADVSEVAALDAATLDAATLDADVEPQEFGLTRSDTLFAAVVGASLLALTGLHWARLSGWGGREVEIERAVARDYAVRLDVNTANWVELGQLESIGEVLARRIVEDRERHGPFASVDDMRRVKGIGAKTLEKLRPLLKAEPSAAR